jgi:hypothetical protein
VPVTFAVTVPPVPLAVDQIVVQLVASFEVWIEYAVAYAASQVSTTCWSVSTAPRSTCSHCGSLNRLPQRVVVSPSVA